MVYYANWRSAIRESAQAHLGSVASAQQSRLSALMDQNAERLALVASRTQLRLSLDQFLARGEPKERERMEHILADAARSLPSLVYIAIYSPAGEGIASSRPGQGVPPFPDPSLLSRARRGAVLDLVQADESGVPGILLLGPLHLEDRVIGLISLRTKIEPLTASLLDYSGLGETGESLLLRPEGSDHVFLSPTRFAPDAALQSLSALAGSCANAQDLLRADGVSERHDYRGVTVIAENRPIPHSDWTLVVKVDRQEAFRELRRTTQVAALGVGGLVALTVLLALALARSLTRPLTELSRGVARITEGHLEGHVRIRYHDEIGALAEGFNTMVDRLAEIRGALVAKVAELNAEIQERKAVEADREQIIGDLRKAMSEIQTLEGIIPICASCKKIRDDKGYWSRIESYFATRAKARFSHGLCPDCLQHILGSAPDT